MDISPVLIDLSIKSTLLLVLVLGITRFVKRMSSAERHLIWCLAFSSLVLLPLLTLVVPGYLVTVPVGEMIGIPDLHITMHDGVDPPSGADASTDHSAGFISLPGLLRNIRAGTAISSAYAIIVFILLLHLGFICVRIRRSLASMEAVRDPEIQQRIRAVTKELGISRDIKALWSDLEKTPWTWGVMQPQVILPLTFSEWPPEEQHSALIHELSHIRRFDLLSIVITRICCSIYWFHPLVWIGYVRMVMEAEKACDNRVLLSGSRASDYATQLTAVAGSILNVNGTRPLIAAMAGCSALSHRVRDILDGGIRRDGVTARTVILATATVLVVSLALVACQIIPRDSAQDTASAHATAVNTRREAGDRQDLRDSDSEGLPASKPVNAPGSLTMRHRVFDRLGEVRDLVESGSAEQGIALLKELELDPDLYPYERAQVHNYYAYAAYQLDRYDDAIHQYMKVLEQQDIPQALVLNSTYTLAQLHFMQEDYAASIESLNRWFDLTGHPTREGYILLGQAYYQLGKYHESIVPLEKAYELASAGGDSQSRDLLLLMRAAYSNMGNTEKARQITREIGQLNE